VARQLTFGSLFAGIGGFDLGFERAGMRCAWQVEIDPFCQRVLAKHWPDVRRWDDVRTFPPEPTEDWTCDVICGGFPCQDISSAGKKVGIGGERSRLWSEFARVIRLVRPRYVVVENVAALLDRGMGRVLQDLVGLGMDAEWGVLSACAFGAPHARERLFLCAYPTSVGQPKPRLFGAHADRDATDGVWQTTDAVDAIRRGAVPALCGIAHGVPRGVDRLRGLGNAVVPQGTEWIGRRIVEAVDPTL